MEEEGVSVVEVFEQSPSSWSYRSGPGRFAPERSSYLPREAPPSARCEESGARSRAPAVLVRAAAYSFLGGGRKGRKIK